MIVAIQITFSLISNKFKLHKNTNCSLELHKNTYFIRAPCNNHNKKHFISTRKSDIEYGAFFGALVLMLLNKFFAIVPLEGAVSAPFYGAKFAPNMINFVPK